MKYLIILIAPFILFACGGEKPAAVLTESDIDAYIAEKLDTGQIYDITQSLRFSRENEAYTVVIYSQNDTSILINEEIESEGLLIRRNTYYMQGEPVFIEEFGFPVSTDSALFVKKIYIHNNEIIQAYKKETMNEWELEETPFQKSADDLSRFDFQRPIDAVEQQGAYEMLFGEFLDIDPARYLILENPASKFNVALFVAESDFLLEDMHARPENYESKTIFVHHEFVNMGGIVRMVWLGGIVKED